MVSKECISAVKEARNGEEKLAGQKHESWTFVEGNVICWTDRKLKSAITVS